MMAAPGPSWTERWNAYWFPATGTRRLAVCRILAVAAQLFWFPPVLERNLTLVRQNADFIDPQLFLVALTTVVPRALLFNPSVLTGLHWVMLAAGALALVGLFTRASLFVFAACIWIFVAHLYSFADVHHESTIFAIVLLALAFAPSGDRLSVDGLLRRRRGERSPAVVDNAMWPLKLAHVLLALTYFSTGMSKLITGGLQWMNGYTLQAYVFGDAVPRGFPLGVWLGQQHTLAIALSIFTIVFEVFFFLSLVFPRTAPLWFLGGIGFQAGLYAAAGHDFFPHMVLLAMLLVAIGPDWWRENRDVLARVAGRPEARAAPAGRELPLGWPGGSS